MSKQCNNYANYRYTWPGRYEALCCEKHANGIQYTAKAIGFNIQMISLSEKDLEQCFKCQSYD